MSGTGDLPGRVLPLALQQTGPTGGGEPEDRRSDGAIHAESPDKAYRRIRNDLARCRQKSINDKRALRI